MRAREFTINVPITISINGDDDPVVSAGEKGSQEPDSTDELQQNPVMVPPLQQNIELMKAAMGKESPVIDKLTQDHPDIGDEPDDDSQLMRLKQLASQSAL